MNVCGLYVENELCKQTDLLWNMKVRVDSKDIICLCSVQKYRIVKMCTYVHMSCSFIQVFMMQISPMQNINVSHSQYHNIIHVSISYLRNSQPPMYPFHM